MIVCLPDNHKLFVDNQGMNVFLACLCEDATGKLLLSGMCAPSPDNLVQVISPSSRKCFHLVHDLEEWSALSDTNKPDQVELVSYRKLTSQKLVTDGGHPGGGATTGSYHGYGRDIPPEEKVDKKTTTPLEERCILRNKFTVHTDKRSTYTEGNWSPYQRRKQLVPNENGLLGTYPGHSRKGDSRHQRAELIADSYQRRETESRQFSICDDSPDGSPFVRQKSGEAHGVSLPNGYVDSVGKQRRNSHHYGSLRRIVLLRAEHEREKYLERHLSREYHSDPTFFEREDSSLPQRSSVVRSHSDSKLQEILKPRPFYDRHTLSNGYSSTVPERKYRKKLNLYPPKKVGTAIYTLQR